jgi:carbon monoxide dehydrogenase subunit G
MKFTGELIVSAPCDATYDKIRDARFFASCVKGVRDLTETGADRYAAIFETKVAFMNFKFEVDVEVTAAERPRRIDAKIEGRPLGIVGRLSAVSSTELVENANETIIRYTVTAALTGKLGSLGQPVLNSKAKEMQRQFAESLRAAFQTDTQKLPL